MTVKEKLIPILLVVWLVTLFMAFSAKTNSAKAQTTPTVQQQPIVAERNFPQIQTITASFSEGDAIEKMRWWTEQVNDFLQKNPKGKLTWQKTQSSVGYCDAYGRTHEGTMYRITAVITY